MSYQKLAQALNDSVNMYTPDVLYPRECLIIDVNEDETLKIKVNIGENIYLDEVRYIGIPKTNTIGLFIPLNNNYDEGYCICYNETTESLTENVIINNINSSETEEVNDVNESEEETSEEITNETTEETQANINYDRRYAKINHTHTENVGTIEDLKTLIKNTKEGNILSLNQNFKNERYGNIIINKKITIDGNGHSIENISFTCDVNEIELNNIVFFNVTTNRVNGGALQLNGQRISINNCIFYNNIINGTSVYEGGAISVNSSSIETKITDCYFISNFCSNNGGAVRWIGNDGVLIGCKFIGNTATNSGGAIKWLGINGLVRDCLFEDNKSNNAKDIFTTDENLLGIGNKFLTESDVIGSERFYDYITEYDKKEIEDEIHSSFGRNILYDTQEMIVGTPPNNISYIGEFRNNKVICFDDESSNKNGYRDWYYDIPIDEFNYNDEFTLSFWVRSNKENIGKIKAYFTGDIKNKVINSNGYDYSDVFNDGHIVFNVNDEWKKCFVTWKLDSTGDSTTQKRLIIRIFDGAEIYLSSPKLERGKVSTDWTPNPNDKISNYQIIGREYVDLNNIQKTGIYRCESNSNIGNLPLGFQGVSFVLEVVEIGSDSCRQRITFNNNVKTFEHIRTMKSSNWSQWQIIENQVNCICHTTNATGSDGFGKLMKIKNILPTTNYNVTIGFDVYQKNKKFPVRCYLKFKNENIENFNIESFYYYGENSDIYIINSNDKEWDLYVKKSDEEDIMEIKNLTINDAYTTKENKLEFYPLNEEITQDDFLLIYDETDTHSAKVVKSDYCLDKEQTDGYYLSLNGGNIDGDLNVNGYISSGNIVTELSTSSTDEEIPTAKTVYDSFEQIFEKDYNVNNTILNEKLYVGKLIQGRIDSSSVMFDSNNELVFTTANLYDTYWFIQKMNFAENDDWDLSFNIRKPIGTYVGKDFGIVIGDENNYIKLFMGFYDIVIEVNGTELSKRSGGVYAKSDTPIKISRRGNDWEFNYNNGEYVANVSTDGYDIPNKFIVQDMNWDGTGWIYINNVVFNPIDKKSSIFDLIYPIGSIYMSVNNINPNVLFGGRWEQLKDKFLLGDGDVYENGSTGGSADAVVVKHNHTQNPHNHTQNAHSHSPGNDRSFMTAPTGSGWKEIAGSNVSGSGYHYVVTQDKSNYNVYVAGSGSATATNKEATATNKEAGEDGTGKNMPPYLTVYMWKRIG